MGTSNGPGRRPAKGMRVRAGGTWSSTVPGSLETSAASRAGAKAPPFTAHQAHDANGPWLVQDFFEFSALASAVPCARRHARHVLRQWHLTSIRETAGLLVTELATNAVNASRAVTQATRVRLWLASGQRLVLILVWDASPQPLVRTEASGEAENGRGLMLVEALSEQWGWYRDGNTNGKFVWATLQADRGRNVQRP